MAVAVTMASVLIVSSSWCLKTMGMWLEQYSVLVRRTLIPRTLELVFLQSATINYFHITSQKGLLMYIYFSLSKY